MDLVLVVVAPGGFLVSALLSLVEGLGMTNRGKNCMLITDYFSLLTTHYSLPVLGPPSPVFQILNHWLSIKFCRVLY